MSKSSKKIYIVWKGRHPGVYHSWDECKQQVNGFPGAVYKSFKDLSRSEALELLQNQDYAHDIIQRHPAPIVGKSSPMAKEKAREEEVDFRSICVDAACSHNPGKMEYRAVYTSTGEELFHSQIYPRGTNNIGEFLAIVHAMAWLVKEAQSLIIYSDSLHAMKWVQNKEIKTTLPREPKTEHLWQHIDRALAWLRQHDISSFDVRKWQTRRWGEIPADFGRK